MLNNNVDPLFYFQSFLTTSVKLFLQNSSNLHVYNIYLVHLFYIYIYVELTRKKHKSFIFGIKSSQSTEQPTTRSNNGITSSENTSRN